MSADEIMQTIAQLTSIGFAVWYAWWTTTHTIPKMQESHDMLIDKVVTEFRSDLREQRMDFLKQLAVTDATSEKMCNAVTDLKTAIKEIHKIV